MTSVSTPQTSDVGATGTDHTTDRAERIERIRQAAYRIRRNALEMGEVQGQGYIGQALGVADVLARSEERRVGKECRSRWSPYH